MKTARQLMTLIKGGLKSVTDLFKLEDQQVKAGDSLRHPPMDRVEILSPEMALMQDI